MSTLTVTLRQPTQVVPDRRADNLRTTRPYIPGWVVRGAFAAAWIREYGPPTLDGREEFIEVFEGGVRFGPLLAGCGFHGLSELTHKYRTTCDVTVDLAFVPDPTDDDCAYDVCQACQAPLEPARGLRTVPSIGRRTSTQIHAREVAAAEKLYSQDSLRPAQTLSGELIGDDAHLEWLGDLTPIHLGGRATTHGHVDRSFADSADDWMPFVRDDGLLVLRLASPAVFVDDDGRPTTRPMDAELSAQLKVPARVTNSWTRWEQIGGWHAASGLPKPVETAVEAGSTYLVATTSPIDPEALLALRRRGLGIRRHEGFGHLQPTLDPAVSRQLQRLAGTPGDYAAALGYATGTGPVPDITAPRGTQLHSAWRRLLQLSRTDAARYLRDLSSPSEDLT